jgi:hypothetical protein
MKIIFISGVPATGKSYFGTWLKEEKNFLHFDVEKDTNLEKYNLKKYWDNCFKTNQTQTFVKKLQKLQKSVVLNWGFPTCYLYFAQDIKTRGVQIWWFDAEHSIARNAFLKRGSISLPSFDNQVDYIRKDWKKIESTFSPNILKTLQDDGNYLAPDKIYNHIFMSTAY